jgi:hypothetical protein
MGSGTTPEPLLLVSEKHIEAFTLVHIEQFRSKKSNLTGSRACDSVCQHFRNSQAEVSPKYHGVSEFGFGYRIWADIDGRI